MAWTQFAALTAATGGELDANLNTLSALTPIPVSVSGTNTLALTSIQGAGSVTSYSNYMQFTGVAAATNTGSVTAQFGSLTALPVYKDTPAGPVVLSGGEIVVSCALSLTYDSALNTGAGGFHLQTQRNLLTGLVPNPVSVSGTNTLALTLLTTAVSISAYANYMQFIGVVANTNTGAVTAAVGALSALNVYKDTAIGPVALTGGELVANCEFILMYDSTLNSGAGGFHLQFQPGQTRNLSTTGTITWSAITPGSTQDQTLPLPGCLVGDIALLGPPASIPSGITLSARVSANGTITVRAANVTTGSTITPAAVAYRVGAQGYN